MSIMLAPRAVRTSATIWTTTYSPTPDAACTLRRNGSSTLTTTSPPIIGPRPHGPDSIHEGGPRDGPCA